MRIILIRVNWLDQRRAVAAVMKDFERVQRVLMLYIESVKYVVYHVNVYVVYQRAGESHLMNCC